MLLQIMASLANFYILAMQLFMLNTLLSYTIIKAVQYDHTTNREQITQCQNSKCNKYTVQELTEDELFISGHLKPFGSHRPPDEVVEELPFMISPEDFYMNYVIKHKPVVLKGIQIIPCENLAIINVQIHYGDLG